MQLLYIIKSLNIVYVAYIVEFICYIKDSVASYRISINKINNQSISIFTLFKAGLLESIIFKPTLTVVAIKKFSSFNPEFDI